MATLPTNLDGTPSPTPPPIPSQSNDINDNRPSYRRSSRPNTNKPISTFYENSDQKKKIGQLIEGAPTKEHRLLEYFLVISYGNELKTRDTSPLMDIFDNFTKRTHHHHAYVVHPNQTQHQKKRHSHKHKRKHKSIIPDEKQEEKGNNLSPTSKSPKPPRTPPPPTPTLTSIDYSNIEKIRQSSTDLNSEENSPFASLRFDPCVIDRFPPLDHADTAIISTDTQLQYFCLPTGLFLTKFPSLPIFYTFVWTPETGEHLYGCCLRFFEPVNPTKIHEYCQKNKDLSYLNISDCKGYFAPKCICIISYHSFIDGYRVFLTELYRLSLTPSVIPIERYLCNCFLECPLPPKGYFSVRYNIGDKSFLMARAPANNPLSESCVSTRVLFELFTIDTIMTIYKSILLEDKILFISTQYSILSVICEIFVSLLYPFEWPHVYIPMLPEDFLAFLKAPTVFMIGTQKSLLMQIGDELDDDILVVDINTGTTQYGYNCNKNKVNISNIPSIELPKHEKLKLVRFLTPVSNLLYGSRQHDFHQLDLAFPVAPTPDMIEQQEQLQKQRFKKMKTHTSHRRKNSDSLKAIHPSYSDTNVIDEYINNENDSDNKDKKKRFSLNKFKFKKPNISKMTSLTNSFNLRNRSDSIEPPIKSYSKTPFNMNENLNKSKTKKPKSKLKRSQSETAKTINDRQFKKQDSGTLADIVESPINAIFDDAAVRNGFLRFWLSIFRSYQECIIRPNVNNNNNLSVRLSGPIYEDSATKSADKKPPIPTEDELHVIHNKNDANESSKSGTSSFNSINSGTSAGLMFGQSVESIFDEDKFLKSSPSQSRPFLSIFLGTESFNRFISKCVFEYDTNTNVKYFNEKIIQKLGRSRFTKAQPTPFLNNKDYIISHEFLCPKPFIDDLPKGKKYIYPEWPKLNPNLYCKPRRKYRHKSRVTNTTNSKSSNYTNKDIIDNIYDESSITFEPSKSQTITSTIISPPHKKPTHNNAITPHDKYYYNDDNIIREEDEMNDMHNASECDDVIVLQLGDINNKERTNSNPFSHDRVTYHLWFYIFIRTLIPNNSTETHSQERALHLMIKIMSQMKNENVGLPDKWVFTEIIQSMDRMKWGSHVIKLVQVMHQLQYVLDATIYSSLLEVLTKEYGDLETAYNILGKLPSESDEINNVVRDRNNSLLMNCNVKPAEKRKKFYETIRELQNRFSLTFPGRSIIIKQECPYCSEAIHDVHIRMGWSNNDQSTYTKCPSCHKQFDAKFLIKESQTYKVWFHNIQSIKALKFFKMRGDKGTYIECINFKNISNEHINKERQNAIINTISEGDQIININGKDITNKSLNEIYEIIKNPPPINDNNNLIQVPEIEESLSSSQRSDSNENNNSNHIKILKKQSTKSKLMKFMKLNEKSNSKKSDPICITFRRVVLCPYFSPLILYREIKKVIQNYALSQNNNNKTRRSVTDIINENEDENKENIISYRKKSNISKTEIKKLLQESGISAITNSDFRTKYCQLFWNLAWHFNNLRLPLHFLQNAFEDKSQINTPQIDDLIHFVPLTSDNK